MRLFEALISELNRLESVTDEQWNYEMNHNRGFAVLVFAAKSQLETIAWCSVQAPVYPGEVDDHEKVNQIVEKVLRS